MIPDLYIGKAKNINKDAAYFAPLGWQGSVKTLALEQTSSKAQLRQHSRVSKLQTSQKASPSRPLRGPQSARFPAEISTPLICTTSRCAQC